jgi:microcystin-dependent protein
MSEPYLGEVRMFGGNFAPSGWALCDGSLLPIQRYTALFSILGTTYGGDGKTTFGLPNLQGSAPMHWGDGPGLTPRSIGEAGGSTTVTLSQPQIPQHNHAVAASGSTADQTSPQGNVPAGAQVYAPPPLAAQLATSSIQPAGGGQPHNNMQPYQAVTFIIALQGIFPSRG